MFNDDGAFPVEKYELNQTIEQEQIKLDSKMIKEVVDGMTSNNPAYKIATAKINSNISSKHT